MSNPKGKEWSAFVPPPRGDDGPPRDQNVLPNVIKPNPSPTWVDGLCGDDGPNSGLYK